MSPDAPHRTSHLYLITSAIACLLILFAAAGCGEKGDERVISKRVKIDLPEKKADEDLPEESVPEKKVTAEGAAAPVGEGSPMTGAIVEADEKPAATFPARNAEAEAARARAVVEAKARAEAAARSAPSADRLRFASANPWAINVASFSRASAASDLRKRLNEAGYNAYTTEFIKDGKTWHRVRVGFYPTRDKALFDGKKIEITFRTAAPWVVKPATEEVTANITGTR